MSRISARCARSASLFALVIVAACGETTANQSGRLTLLLTDAPGDFKHAVVTIDQIYMQSSAGSEGGRVILRDEDVTTDLLTLANSTDELVTEAVLPAGSYSELRFVISGAYIEVENVDGTTSIYASSPNYAGLPAGTQVTGSLQMPSFAQSGLKVKLPGDAVEVGGEEKVLLVDFDVSRSFGKLAGNSGQWVMTPVLEATTFAVSASISATVSKADSVSFPQINGAAATLGGFQAVLTTAAGSQELAALTDANGDGTFEAQFRYVAPGDYQLDLRAPSDSIQFTTTPGRPAPVTLTSGQSASTAFVITSARK